MLPVGSFGPFPPPSPLPPPHPRVLCGEQAREFVKETFPAHGVKPCPRTYQAFITMFAERKTPGSTDAAMNMLAAMKEHGVQPTKDVRGPFVRGPFVRGPFVHWPFVHWPFVR